MVQGTPDFRLTGMEHKRAQANDDKVDASAHQPQRVHPHLTGHESLLVLILLIELVDRLSDHVIS